MAVYGSKASSTFGATGQSSVIGPAKDVTLSIEMSAGSVNLERSFDGGSSWKVVETYTADDEDQAHGQAFSLWRLNCTSYTSTITYVLVAAPTGKS